MHGITFNKMSIIILRMEELLTMVFFFRIYIRVHFNLCIEELLTIRVLHNLYIYKSLPPNCFESKIGKHLKTTKKIIF